MHQHQQQQVLQSKPEDQDMKIIEETYKMPKTDQQGNLDHVVPLLDQVRMIISRSLLHLLYYFLRQKLRLQLAKF